MSALAPVLREKKPAPSNAFKPGQSGNPGGRRPSSYHAWVEKFKTLEDDIFDMAKTVINERPVTTAGVNCGFAIIHQIHGKPPVRIEGALDININVSERMIRARARAARLVLEGVAQVIEDEESKGDGP
jgi:hypothetical protein